MARPGPRKPTVTIRLDGELLAEVAEWADKTGVARTVTGEINRSEAITRLLWAALHMIDAQ